MAKDGGSFEVDCSHRLGYNFNMKQTTSILVPIADLARTELLIDRLCPDVGMGMSAGVAIHTVLERYDMYGSE